MQAQPSQPRFHLAPESALVLVLAALTVGLIIGQAVGRRQSLVVRQVVVQPSAGDTSASAMAASAPKAPESMPEARQMVASMGAADVPTLVDLGRRKLHNKVLYLAAAFLEKALAANPNQPAVWCDLGDAYVQLHLWDEAGAALDQALTREPGLARAKSLQIQLAEGRGGS